MGLVESQSEQSAINLLSLFSGCGGLDLGFEGNFKVMKHSINTAVNKNWNYDVSSDDYWVLLPKTKFTTVFANDIREDAKISWENYFKKNDVYHLGSIVDLVKTHINGEKVFPDNIDIVTGGFPCQDFSVAGKRKGLNSNKAHNGGLLSNDAPSIESRGQLYMWMRSVIEITKPKVFIAENVKGLVDFGDVKTIIENDFRSIDGDGYIVTNAQVLHAADYGVPQSRERVIFVGFRKSALNKAAIAELSVDNISDKFSPYPIPTHSYTKQEKNLLPPTNLKQAFEGLKEPELSQDLSQQKYSMAKFMGNHCQGQIEVTLNGIGPTIRSEHHGNIEYRRLSKENGGIHEDELAQGLKERRLTVRECARIQTFPDDYEFVFNAKNGIKGVSASSAYKLIGNAVPPLLGYHIAKRLENNWNLYFGDDEN